MIQLFNTLLRTSLWSSQNDELLRTPSLTVILWGKASCRLCHTQQGVCAPSAPSFAGAWPVFSGVAPAWRPVILNPCSRPPFPVGWGWRGNQTVCYPRSRKSSWITEMVRFSSQALASCMFKSHIFISSIWKWDICPFSLYHLYFLWDKLLSVMYIVQDKANLCGLKWLSLLYQVTRERYFHWGPLLYVNMINIEECTQDTGHTERAHVFERNRINILKSITQLLFLTLENRCTIYVLSSAPIISVLVVQ